MDFEETISRIGCYYTPLLCQFSSFRKTEYAAYERGYNISLWRSKLIDRHEDPNLDSIHPNQVNLNHKSTFTKEIET